MAKRNNPPQAPATPKSALSQAVSGIHQPQQAQVTQQVTHQQVTYEGPIPPPEVLRGYETVHPGAAERIIRMAEKEAEQRQMREAEALRANVTAQQRQLDIAEVQTKLTFRSDLIGQCCGLFLSLASVGSAVYLGINGHEWIAAALAGIPTAAVVKAFLIDKPVKQKPTTPQ